MNTFGTSHSKWHYLFQQLPWRQEFLKIKWLYKVSQKEWREKILLRLCFLWFSCPSLSSIFKIISITEKTVSINRINTEMGLCFLNKSQSWTPCYFSQKLYFNLPVIVELKCHRQMTFEIDFIVICSTVFGAQCTLTVTCYFYVHLSR